MPVKPRRTRQKEAIRHAFEQAGRPLSPEEALAASQTEAGAVSLATVYRNISALIAERWLTPVGVPGEPARYEIFGKGHHHHFHCRSCGRIFDLAGCSLPGSTLDLPAGFSLSGHELFLYGTCAQCAPAAGSALGQ